MGKLHRLKRAFDKSVLKRLGVKETELGELRKVESKAEARRRYLLRYRRTFAEEEVLQVACELATRAITEEEDARVLAMIEATIASTSVTQPPQ